MVMALDYPLLVSRDIDMVNAYPPLDDVDDMPELELMGVPQGSAESAWAGMAPIADSDDDDMPDEDMQNEYMAAGTTRGCGGGAGGRDAG